MKKIIAILVAAILTLSMSAGFVMAAEEELTGVWYAQSMESEGLTMDASTLASMGMNITVTLNEDGTAVVAMAGQAMEGVWDEEGIDVNESKIPYQLVDGQLIVENGGSTLVLGREEPEALDTTLAPVVENPEISDFDGVWNPLTYVNMGFALPTMIMGFDISLDIKNGEVALTEVHYDLADNFAETEKIEKNLTAQLNDDGTLFVSFDGEELLTSMVNGASGIVLTLHEDGRMSGEIPELNEQMKMIEEMLADSENESAEENESADDAEGGVSVGVDTGASDGSSSGGFSMTAYLIFEKAE